MGPVAHQVVRRGVWVQNGRALRVGGALSLQTRRYGHVGYLRGSRMALQLREVRVWEVVGVVAEIRSWWNYRIGNFTFSRVNSSVCGGWGGGISCVGPVCGWGCVWMRNSPGDCVVGGIVPGERERDRDRDRDHRRARRSLALTHSLRSYDDTDDPVGCECGAERGAGGFC